MMFALKKVGLQVRWILLVSLLVVARSTDAQEAPARVQIEIVRQMHGLSNGAVAYHSAHEEFAQLKALMKQRIKDSQSDMEPDIRRFPGKFDSELPRITLYVHEWRSLRSGEVRAVLGARYRGKGKREDMGSFMGQTVMPVSTMRTLRDEAYHEAMRKACDGFLERLGAMVSDVRYGFRQEGETRE